MFNFFKSQSGAIPMPVLISAIGVIVFLAVASTFSFKNNLFDTLFPKPQSSAAGVVELSIMPSPAIVAINNNINLEIYIDTKGEMVSAAQIQVNFDQNYFEGVSIQGGSFLPNILAPGTVNPGSAAITLGSDPTSPKSGTGVLAILTLTAKQAVSSSEVSLDAAKTQVAALGKSVNVVGVLNSSNVSINNVTQPQADTTPPIISVTSPTNGGFVTRKSTINIAANATDDIKVSKVEFYIVDKLQCTDTTLPYGCSWYVSAKPNAQYTVMAKATDSANNTSSHQISVRSK